MTNRMPLRGNPRVTPMMMNSFSRLTGSSGGGSLNGTADSGYQSSFASSNSSLTPSTYGDSSSLPYCSTPVASDSFSSHRTNILNQTVETPVHPVRYSEDRIPRHIPILSSSVEVDAVLGDDCLSCLIRNSAPPIKRILQFLGDEDLVNFCQVSDSYCRAVCNDQTALRRVSKFLISARQNVENRTTSIGHNSRPYGGILRPIQNVLNVNATPGAVWTIPSALESIDVSNIPRQFKRLVEMTKGLSEHQHVTSCHTCRNFVPIRDSQQNKATVCRQCQPPMASRRGNPSSRITTKKIAFR